MPAKELLALGLDNYAFVPFRLALYWAVARGLDFIQTDAGGGIGVADVVERMGVIRCTAEILFKRETGKTILQAINDPIYELARAEFAKGHPSVRAVAERLGVSRNTLDRIFVRRTGRPAGGR